MKRLTLKMKLTIVYTFFMILVTCMALIILFSLSNREVLSSTQAALRHHVENGLDNIEIEDGKLEIDSDFYSVEDNVYLSVYDTNGYFLYGKVPYGFDEQPEMSDGELRRIREKYKEWYVLDLSVHTEETQEIYIRGITSVTDAEESFRITIRFAVILLPLMVGITAFLGYRFTRRTLLPVRQITDTVRQIQADADMSRRIGLQNEADKNNPRKRSQKNRDEIYDLAETFDEMLEQLEKVFQREQQFTADVSHELRTPVSVIMAQCDACLADESLSRHQKEQILLIYKKTKGMAEMISQLLLLSRADQGRQPFHREQLNISELTELVAEEQQLLANTTKNSIKIVQNIEPDIFAPVDETFYIRMLVNLISNAITYSKENGIIEIRLFKTGNEVIGSVQDNGIGISSDDLPHIWERFYRTSTSRNGNHSGLGLSMVQWIVKAHGGWIKAESVPGEGSNFTFGLPLEYENVSKPIEKL